MSEKAFIDQRYSDLDNKHRVIEINWNYWCNVKMDMNKFESILRERDSVNFLFLW